MMNIIRQVTNNLQRFPNVATYGPMNPDDCNDFEFGKVNTPQGAATAKFATEHILEYQLYTIFLDAMKDKFGQNYRKNPLKTGTNSVDMCKYMKPYWQPGGRLWFILDGGTERKNPLNWVGSVFPGKNNAYESEFVLLPQDINGPKARVCYLFKSNQYYLLAFMRMADKCLRLDVG